MIRLSQIDKLYVRKEEPNCWLISLIMMVLPWFAASMIVCTGMLGTDVVSVFAAVLIITVFESFYLVWLFASVERNAEIKYRRWTLVPDYLPTFVVLVCGYANFIWVTASIEFDTADPTWVDGSGSAATGGYDYAETDSTGSRPFWQIPSTASNLTLLLAYWVVVKAPLLLRRFPCCGRTQYLRSEFVGLQVDRQVDKMLYGKLKIRPAPIEGGTGGGKYVEENPTAGKDEHDMFGSISSSDEEGAKEGDEKEEQDEEQDFRGATLVDRCIGGPRYRNTKEGGRPTRRMRPVPGHMVCENMRPTAGHMPFRAFSFAAVCPV